MSTQSEPSMRIQRDLLQRPGMLVTGASGSYNHKAVGKDKGGAEALSLSLTKGMVSHVCTCIAA